jgi:hypothetical protein
VLCPYTHVMLCTSPPLEFITSIQCPPHQLCSLVSLAHYGLAHRCLSNRFATSMMRKSPSPWMPTIKYQFTVSPVGCRIYARASFIFQRVTCPLSLTPLLSAVPPLPRHPNLATSTTTTPPSRLLLRTPFVINVCDRGASGQFASTVSGIFLDLQH